MKTVTIYFLFFFKYLIISLVKKNHPKAIETINTIAILNRIHIISSIAIEEYDPVPTIQVVPPPVLFLGAGKISIKTFQPYGIPAYEYVAKKQ